MIKYKQIETYDDKFFYMNKKNELQLSNETIGDIATNEFTRGYQKVDICEGVKFYLVRIFEDGTEKRIDNNDSYIFEYKEDGQAVANALSEESIDYKVVVRSEVVFDLYAINHSGRIKTLGAHFESEEEAKEYLQDLVMDNWHNNSDVHMSDEYRFWSIDADDTIDVMLDEAYELKAADKVSKEAISKYYNTPSALVKK